jgi:hypothetical protein
MSNLLEDLKQVIDNSGIFTDYEAHSYFGINDDSETFRNASKWTAFKVDGGGPVDPIYSEPNIRLWVGGSSSNNKTFYDDINSIIDFMNANYSNSKIMNILVQSDVNGPYSLSSGRSFFEIHLRLTQDRS